MKKYILFINGLKVMYTLVYFQNVLKIYKIYKSRKKAIKFRNIFEIR